MNKKLIFFVLLICLLAFVAVMVYSHNASDICWEYVVHSVSTEAGGSLTVDANAMGQEGWELVAAHHNALNDRFYMYYKRKLQ